MNFLEVPSASQIARKELFFQTLYLRTLLNSWRHKGGGWDEQGHYPLLLNCLHILLESAALHIFQSILFRVGKHRGGGEDGTSAILCTCLHSLSVKKKIVWSSNPLLIFLLKVFFFFCLSCFYTVSSFSFLFCLHMLLVSAAFPGLEVGACFIHGGGRSSNLYC